MKKKIGLILSTILIMSIFVGLLVACSDSDINGRYYKYKGDKKQEDTWIELQSGKKWLDDDGETGEYTLEGNVITLWQDGIDWMSGTIEDGVITFTTWGTSVYKKDGATDSTDNNTNTGNGNNNTNTGNNNTDSGDNSGGSIGSEEVDDGAKVISITGGKVEGLVVSLEVAPEIEEVELSGMLEVSKNSSWQLYADKKGQTLIPTKYASELRPGENLYYIVVNSSDDKVNRTYTLSIWRNFYAEIKLKANDQVVKSYTALSHTTLEFDPPSEMTGYDLTWNLSSYYVTEQFKIFTASTVTPKKYTITLNTDGGNLSNNKFTATYDKAYTLPIPTKTGYTFVGWYYGSKVMSGKDGVALEYKYAQDVTYKAHWEANSYNVTVQSANTDEGTVNNISGEYDYNSSVTLRATPKAGYSFEGWYLNSIYGTCVSTNSTYTVSVPAYNVTYVAKFTYYCVTTNANLSNAGTYTSYSNKKISAGERVTLTATTNVGYTWLGWYDGETKVSEGTSLSYTFTMGEESKTYTAKWEKCTSHTPDENCECTVCETAVHAVNGLCRHGDYVYFGSYPQTIKEDDVTITTTTNDKGYYLGSDNEWYAKVTASPYESNYTFSTGTTVTSGTVYYFKVEPIRWRILTESNGKAFILCDSVVDTHIYDDSSNNYANSEIRAWLNDTFYDTAFSTL
ncbi:MAG: InlB B-repeat-containing protein, partial [Clostridia bacterium]|nr:InlB B-repeat-containing protein [Clostridia bacterium]